MAKRNKMLRKILVTMCSAVLLVGATVGVTVAYLTSTTEVVKNTFTVGNVKITLDEAKVTEYGVKDGDTRVTENTYKLIPGHEYIKDPMVHVADGSEESWLFVKVTNDIASIEADGETDTIAEQMAANGWSAVAGTTGVYAYKETVNAGDNIPVFGEFTLSDAKTNEEVAAFAGKTITVQAYAVQKDGFDTAAAAWTDAPLATWVATN